MSSISAPTAELGEELMQMQILEADAVASPGADTMSSISVPTADLEQDGNPSQRSGVERLTEDCTIEILWRLSSPTDLENARVVCKGWYNAVIAGEVWRVVCERMCEEVTGDVSVLPSGTGQEGGEPSLGVARAEPMVRELEGKARVLRVLGRIFEGGALETAARANILFREIHASSTDQLTEGIVHTLHPEPQYNDVYTSYWSSKGSYNAEKEEKLTYWLEWPVCIVHEIGIRPFKAMFQNNNPIYSAKQVRFRFGYSTKGYRPNELLDVSLTAFLPSRLPPPPDYSEFVWSYESPVFPMEQEDELQMFKLPKPVLVLGGVVQVELIGRVQVQEIDLAYYICICHVCVEGQVLTPLTCEPSPVQPGVTLSLLDPEACQTALEYMAAKTLYGPPLIA